MADQANSTEKKSLKTVTYSRQSRPTRFITIQSDVFLEYIGAFNCLADQSSINRLIKELITVCRCNKQLLREEIDGAGLAFITEVIDWEIKP